MRRTYIQFSLIFIGYFIPSFIFAQINDFGGIGTLSLSKKIVKNLNAELEQEFRFKESLSMYDRSKTSIGLDYSMLKKNLKVGLNYDFINQQLDEGNELKHRASIGLSTDYKYNRLEFEIRTRGQLTWRDSERGDYNYNPRYLWRNKLSVTYDIFGSPFEPYLAGELFTPLNGKKGFYLDGVRASTGLKYRATKHSSLKFELRYDQDLQQAAAQNIIYAGLGWEYRL